jgi:hypothetical protein
MTHEKTSDRQNGIPVGLPHFILIFYLSSLDKNKANYLIIEIILLYSLPPGLSNSDRNTLAAISLLRTRQWPNC